MKMIKKIITLIIIISYIVTCNRPCYGFGARTLFQHRSHAQRNLESIDSYRDIINTPSFLSIPQNLGRIVEYHKGAGSTLIVHIQDRHTDPITQNNIASIIKTLNQQYNIHLMCLEGASEELDTSFYDSFKNTPLKEKVARFFVEKALFTGAEFYKITNRANYLRAVGAEDKGIYLEHLANYKNNQISKSAVLNLLRGLRVTADNLRNRVYSKDLKDLDDISRTYLDGEAKFSEYVSKLKAYADRSGTEIKAYPNVEKFIELAEKEKTIDFDGASKEREALVKYFAENLKKEEARELIQLSLDFRLNKLSEIAFYDYLESLITDSGLPTTGYKNLFAYINYLRFSKAINHLEVFNEAEYFEERVQAAFCDNPAQRQLAEYSKAIRILRDLYDLKLTRRRLDYMEENPDFFDITKMQRFLKKRSDGHGLRIASSALFTGLDREVIEESKKFYRLALERDIALTENTLKSMKQYHKDKAILITGGFHTQGITNALKEKDISYVVICPTIGPDDYEKLYNDRMQGLLPDIGALAESFAHMLPAPLYTGGIADKALSSGVQERFAALLGTVSGTDPSIEEKQLTKASSAGRSINVGRDKSLRLPARSPDRLYTALGVCLAVAAFNQKTGEGFLSHIFPVVPAKQSPHAVEWKQYYMDSLIGDIKGGEWNVAVIGSDISFEIFSSAGRRFTVEEITDYLRKNGVKNTQVNPSFAKKVVSFDSTGRVTINLLEHRDIQYAIDLGTQKNYLTGSTTVADVVEKIASKDVKKSNITFKWLNAQRMAQLRHMVKELDNPNTILSEDARSNFADILADFIIRKASQGADHIRFIDAPTKASSGRQQNLCNQAYIKALKEVVRMVATGLNGFQNCGLASKGGCLRGNGLLGWLLKNVISEKVKLVVKYKNNNGHWYLLIDNNIIVDIVPPGHEYGTVGEIVVKPLEEAKDINSWYDIDPGEMIHAIDQKLADAYIKNSVEQYPVLKDWIPLLAKKWDELLVPEGLSEELRVDTNEAIDYYTVPLYDPLSYLGLGRVTFITNARSFTEIDKKHLRKLAMQNRGLSDDDPKKITIITVYDQAKAALKDCGFTDKGKRPSVLGLTDFNYLSDSRWQEIAQGEQIAMIAASIRGQNRAVITITDGKVAGGIVSAIPQYLNDRKKGKIVVASMRGATQRTEIGSDIIEENGIMFSLVLANAVKEAKIQLRENTGRQLFILETLPPIDSMAFEKFIRRLMDTKAAIEATASAA
jgi:hypothetical protein